MDSEGGGGDGGGGEDRDADLSPQALSLPLLTLEVSPEQGSSSHTSATAPAKEPLTLPQQQEEEGAEGSQAREETQGGVQEEEGGRHLQENGACQKQGMKEDFGEGYLSGRREEEAGVHGGVGEASVTGGLPAALCSSSSGEKEKEEEEAISNQSQTKSKCSLLPQQSQHSSSSSTAKASGTLDNKTAASPKPSPTPSASPKPSPFLSTSPKHFTCPSSSPTLQSETEVKDIKGDQGWISEFPQSFKSQPSTLAGIEPASTPAEDVGPAGGPHSSISSVDGAKAPEPNDSQLDTEVDDEREQEEEQKEAVLKNLNPELSPNSLTSHMTIMHSRNSCKTLKCPKCNWHYKSQHTLQVHMKEKHPETGGQCVCGSSGGKCICGGATRDVCGYCSSGKAHPRLARGETYACGYKPYRCEVCDYATSSKGNLSIHMQSDKHLNNVQNGGHSNGHLPTSHVANNSSSSNGPTAEEPAYKLPLCIPSPTAQPAKLTPPAHSHSHGKRWRCDVCDYETSIARNLRIHTTSEKHTHNMLRLQRGYYLSHCRSLAPQLKNLQNTGAELSLNMRLTSQQLAEQPVTLGSALTPSPSPSPSPPPAPSLSPTGPLSQGVFQCLVCSCFSSDSLESVEQHLNATRSLPQSMWCSLVAGGCHCRLCGYTTPLRANFSLHCQTDRHRIRYQLAAHLQEGGDRGQEGEALIAKGNPVQLRCNLCDCVTSSLEKLRGHSLGSHHKASVRVYRFLQQYDGEVDGGSWLFHCLLCNHSSSSKLQVLKHSQTATHQQREGLLQLQPMGGEELAAIFTIRKIPDGDQGEFGEDIETSSETTTGPLDTTKDKCILISEETVKVENKEEEREQRGSFPSVKRSSSGHEELEIPISTKRPRLHQQNENQQERNTVQCPLCQVNLPYKQLQQHLTHVHSVAEDCVDKLISTVTPSFEQPPLMQTEPEPELCSDESLTNASPKINNAIWSNTSNTTDPVDSQKDKGISVENGTLVENAEEEVATPKDVTALLTPPLEDNTTHHSNGRLAPQSPTQFPPSSPPSSPASDPPPLSDRHGYRFRCSRCSLAFPTQEKLQLHWQYHAMRAATECPICSRQCRSQEALHRHMQNTHSQLDNTQGQNTLPTPHTTQFMEINKSSFQQNLSLSPQVGQEAGEAEDEDMEEEEAIDMNRKEETKEGVEFEEKDTIDETDGSEEELTELEKGLHGEIRSEPSSSSPVKRGSNPTMDRYLDPTRPYKCTICSESFTQKTILLVHYNSVSHLHRARRALQDPGTCVTAPEAPRGPDPRPYRCRLCGVGYSQSSTLDIHLRSVLHQTRARAAQNSAPQTPASSVAAPVSVSTTATQAATTREDKTSKCFTKRPNVVSSSTSSLFQGVPAEAQSTLPNPSDNQQVKKRVAELLASRNQLMLIQQQQLAQAQAQAQLQQQTALLQSHLLQHLPLGPENLLKQHFSLTAENLLNLQQQLLLPFYLSGDMKLNSEISVKNPELSQLVSDFSIANYQIETEAKGEFQPKRNEKQIQRQHLNSVFSQHKDPVHREAIVEAGYSRSSVNETERQPGNSSLEEGKEEMPVPTVKNEGQKRETDPSPCNVLGLQCPPPRIPYASVNGEPLRALLQSYGFELALQYIQSRHRNQQQISTHVIPDKQEYCDNKEIGVLSEEKREKVFELQDVRLEGCNTDKDGEEVNGGIEDLPQDEAKKKEESGKKCCGRGKECRDCGKFFSDSLILKSHQEYIHRSLFPTAALERFSREYRLQYDQMYPLPQPKSGEDLTTCPQAAVQAPSSESETAIETVRPQVKTLEPLPSTSVSELVTKTCSPASDPSSTAPPPSSPVHSQPQDFSQEAVNPSTSATVTSHTTSQATSIPLPLPMLPLSLPQLSMPPLTLPKLSLPPGPFPMELPLLSPLVMQSVALQSKPWLDSNVNPELAKLYQSQLNQALLGQQPQLNPSLLAQQPQLSPVLQIQPPQLNPVLLGQKSQPNPTQTGQQQQPQASPTTLEGGKRTRTRISEEQLTVLRKHFDINSLPSDQEINKMSALAGLPLKVIKHWFRNTLFKERQRDKDSPYNFNNPPTIALEESRKEMAQSQPLSLSPCSLSPGLPVNISPEPLTTDIQREELHRGRRSSRTRFTEQQLETLQRVFEATPYPREEEYDRLSARLSLSNRVIVVWFQNARQRARKHQDQGNDDGSEGKNQHDNIHRQRNGRHKNEDYDNDDNSCGDERHSESQNENSMDLTYEYYTHPDSPFVDSTSSCPESEHPTAKGASTPVTGNQEDKIVPHLENTNTDFVQTQNGISDADIKHKDIVPAIKTESSPKPEPTLQPERTAESPAPCSTSSSQKNELTILSTAHSSQGRIHSPLSDQAADTSSLPAPPEQEKSHKLPDSNSGLPTEVQPNIQLPPQTQAQFQCSLCPMSLPSFQLWQEHQTRHLLAAQSQVQFLHSGFPERSMPYMMLHPNHTLMASQMLSGAMSQMHPNPTHPMMSHLNNIQIKNTLSEHSSTSLTSLSQTSLATIKQNSKIISEGSFEGQRSSREIDEEQRRDKRQRTTITPEQLEVLYQRYSMDSNPTRGVLESIARDVGLTRRVVQVWFQNTRARERKGQFRSLGPGSNFSLGFNHLRCPFCRALFKVKSALDAHMRSRHWTEAERAGYNLSMSNGSNGQIGMAMSSVMDRPGPSVSFYPNHGIAISNNQLTVKPSMTSLSTTDLKNQEEEDDYEEDEEEYPCEEGSSLADQGSPSPEGSGGPGAEWGETQALQQQNHQQQRQRTQMSHYQVMQLRDFYRSHRNPNRHECEALGQELGLPHRVVQVWFQNARAKEKRARSLSSDAAEREQAELSAGAGERDRA